MINEVIKIKITSTIDGKETDLSVAELGVLLTAINRCFNQLWLEGADAEISSIVRDFDRINFEPAFVELKISSIKNGCVELIAVINAILEFLNNLPEPQRTLILGMLANAAWDVTKIFTRHFARAAKRIAHTSSGKVISVAITIGKKTSKFDARIGRQRKVSISTSESQLPPDDIH